MIAYYLIFSLTTFVVILMASVIQHRFKGSTSLNIIGIFALIINIAYICDFLYIPVIYFFLILTALVIVFFIKFKELFVHNFKSIFYKTVRHFALYLVSTLILIIPFYLFFPQTAVVTGNFITNDSVVHAIFFEGFQQTSNLNLPDFYQDSYPRGIHSLTYYFSELVNINEKNYVLLISLICVYSLMIFAVKSIINKKGLYFDLISFGIFYPFLMIITIYLNFYSQISVIPFLLIFSYRILNIQKTKSFVEKLFLAIILATTLNIYGVFSFTVGLLFLGIAVLKYIYQKRKIRTLFSKENFLLIGTFLVASFPAIYASINIVLSQFTNRLGSDLINSNGNIPNGFLSAIHLSGFWDPTIDYRGYFINGNSHIEYFAILAIVIISFGIFKIRNNRIKIIIGSLILINILSIVVLKNHYIHFKYLTFLLPTIIVGFLVYLSTFRGRVLKILGVIILIVIGSISLYTQYKYFKHLPFIHSFELDELQGMKENYIDNSATLILTYNDWFQYYTDRSDDYLPLTIYLTKPYNNEPLDYVIIDKGYNNQIQEYLQNNKVLKELVNNSQCPLDISERYRIIDLSCN